MCIYLLIYLLTKYCVDFDIVMFCQYHIIETEKVISKHQFCTV